MKGQEGNDYMFSNYEQESQKANKEKFVWLLRRLQFKNEFEELDQIRKKAEKGLKRKDISEEQKEQYQKVLRIFKVM